MLIFKWFTYFTVNQWSNSAWKKTSDHHKEAESSGLTEATPLFHRSINCLLSDGREKDQHLSNDRPVFLVGSMLPCGRRSESLLSNAVTKQSQTKDQHILLQM